MGISSPNGTKFAHRKPYTLSYGENPEPLSDLDLNRYPVVTDRHTHRDGRTDKITIASTRLASAVARKKQLAFVRVICHKLMLTKW